jgi:hypothetical protein
MPGREERYFTSQGYVAMRGQDSGRSTYQNPTSRRREDVIYTDRTYQLVTICYRVSLKTSHCAQSIEREKAQQVSSTESKKLN